MISKPPGSALLKWWTDEHYLKILFQALFAIVVIFILILAYFNLQAGLEKTGLKLGFDFLGNTAGFSISEGIPYDSSDPYAWAFVVGAVNTLWVSFVGVILATLMGFILGMARLSSHWLSQRLATVVTEVFRNVPLLLVIYFWYLAVLLKLPPLKESLNLFNLIYLSQRGIHMPRIIPHVGLVPMLGCIVAVVLLMQHLRKDRADGIKQAMTLGGVVVVVALFWILAPTPPLQLEIPVLERFNFKGGLQFSTEFTGLVLGLVTYTGAYIAEVVRGGFLAVPKGQWEAARALGFSEFKTFQLVIVPQALRIMLPSLTTQFLTLIKNTTLALTIGYPDLFNVGLTILNQAGRSVEVFSLMILTYLTTNLVVSLGMNLLNHRVKLVER